MGRFGATAEIREKGRSHAIAQGKLRQPKIARFLQRGEHAGQSASKLEHRALAARRQDDQCYAEREARNG